MHLFMTFGCQCGKNSGIPFHLVVIGTLRVTVTVLSSLFGAQNTVYFLHFPISITGNRPHWYISMSLRIFCILLEVSFKLDLLDQFAQ